MYRSCQVPAWEAPVLRLRGRGRDGGVDRLGADSGDRRTAGWPSPFLRRLAGLGESSRHRSAACPTGWAADAMAFASPRPLVRSGGTIHRYRRDRGGLSAR